MDNIGLVKRDISLVSFVLGGGFENTNELKVMKYYEAIMFLNKKWEIVIQEEHEQMKKYKV